MTTRQTTEDYICEKLLELMETKPFHRIKVIDLVNYAKIGRSTFYLYFDSLYDVLQMIEDNYMEGLRYNKGSDSTTIQFLHDRESASNTESQTMIKDDLTYIQKNLNIIRILSSENGDPYFTTRLTIRNRKIVYDLLTQAKVQASDGEKKLLSTFWAGGLWQTVVAWANDEENISTEDFMKVTRYYLKIFNRMLETGQVAVPTFSL